jgi:hypothetical protein
MNEPNPRVYYALVTADCADLHAPLGEKRIVNIWRITK